MGESRFRSQRAKIPVEVGIAISFIASGGQAQAIAGIWMTELINPGSDPGAFIGLKGDIKGDMCFSGSDLLFGDQFTIGDDLQPVDWKLTPDFCGELMCLLLRTLNHAPGTLSIDLQ